MGWYDADFLYRAPITVDNATGAASADVTFTVPDDWDHFWDAIQSDGDDVRITSSDGQTLQSYAWQSFTYASRTGVLEIDGATLSSTAGMDCLWLYYGNDSATDGSAATTIASARSGYIELGRPSTHIIEAQPESPGTTRPRARIQKTSDEQLFVWWRISGLLEQRAEPYNSRRLYEEPLSAAVTVTDGGSAQGSMVSATKQRFVEVRGRGGGIYVRAFIQAGADDTDYTLELDLKTVVPADTSHRILEPRALLRVRDVSEA